MKAIEVLFDKIDELNAQLKCEVSIHEKARKVFRIKEAADLACKIAENANWDMDDNSYM